MDSSDSAIFLEVIEHLHVNPLNALNEISELIKKTGLILLSTPNLFSLKNRINFLRGSYVFEHPFSVYEKISIHGSPGHQRLYSTEELTDMLDTYGFQIRNIWCIDSKSPFLSLKKIKPLLPHDFPFDAFQSFWRENISFKGKIRRNLEILLNQYFSSYYDVIYILAQKNGVFCKDKFYQKIIKSDPWFNLPVTQFGSGLDL